MARVCDSSRCWNVSFEVPRFCFHRQSRCQARSQPLSRWTPPLQSLAFEPSGFFYFVLHCPDDYPHSPPRVRLMTTGGGTVRFNPNLYANGKVCLRYRTRYMKILKIHSRKKAHLAAHRTQHPVDLVSNNKMLSPGNTFSCHMCGTRAQAGFEPYSTVYTTPPGPSFNARLLRNEYDSNDKRPSLGKKDRGLPNGASYRAELSSCYFSPTLSFNDRPRGCGIRGRIRQLHHLFLASLYFCFVA